MPKQDLDELVRAFDRDGFVNGGQVLDAAEIEALRGDLERYVDALFRGREHGIEQPAYHGDLSRTAGLNHYQIAGMWKVSEPFRRLIENDDILRIAACLTRTKTLQIWRDTVQYKPSTHGGSFHWHQDAPYHLSIEPAELLLGVWVAFDDADEQSGCMWMVPGSHLWGQQMGHLLGYEGVEALSEFSKLVPPEAAPEIASQWRDPVPRKVRAGDVHFHHALTWHGSPVNETGRVRRAYTMFLMPEGVRVSTHPDWNLTAPAGTLMVEAGPDFPIVYRAQS